MKKILYFILINLIILFGVLLYSRFLGTKGLDINEIIVNKDIFINYDGFKIVHFSDLHYKKVITDSEVKNLIKAINEVEADIVLFTGDLLDSDYQLKNKDIKFLIDNLKNIESKYGVYAVLGDNDLESLENIKNIYIQSNITLLDNSGAVIYNEDNDRLFIGGISGSLDNNLFNIDNYYKDNFNYHIIMTHEPDNIDYILSKYKDTPLILAGHSINGSFNIPIIKNLLLPNGSKKYYKPYYNINGTDIYISNGIGVNNINFRLFNTPSFNLYRLKKSD